MNVNLLFRRKERKCRIRQFQKETHTEENIDGIFLPFRIYFWLHGIGFEHGFRCSKRKLFHTVVSYILFLIFNGSYLLITIPEIQDCYQIFYRDYMIQVTCLVLELWLRILLYVKVAKIHIINQRLVKVYESTVRGRPLGIKYRISMILLTVDTCSTLMCVFYSVKLIPADSIEEFVNTTYLKFIFPDEPVVYYFTYMTFRNYCIVSPVTVIYFCTYAFILKRILFEIKKKIYSQHREFTQQLYKTYDEISDIIANINQVFGSLLLISFTVFILWVFVEGYPLLFKEIILDEASYFRLYNITFSFTLFLTPCLFSASVAKIALKVKQDLCYLPFDVSSSNRIPFVLKLQKNVVRFTLLGNVAIGKTLILELVGALLTYGIMLATFSANED